MGGGHGLLGLDRVDVVAAGDSPIHRLDPRTKIAALIGLVVVAVTTPDGAWGAFAAYLTLLGAAIVVARLPLSFVAGRMVVEVPFLGTAALLPFVVDDGVVRGGTLALKVTCGVLAVVVLSSTTPFPRLLLGFRRLGAPQLVVLIVGLMWRYVHVVADQVRRMQVARRARGHEPRWITDIGAVGASVGTVFIRSLERGERVHLAMRARGYDGTMPASLLPPLALSRTDALVFGAVAVAVATVRIGLA